MDMYNYLVKTVYRFNLHFGSYLSIHIVQNYFLNTSSNQSNQEKKSMSVTMVKLVFSFSSCLSYFYRIESSQSWLFSFCITFHEEFGIFFTVGIFPYSEWIRRFVLYISVFSLNTGKYHFSYNKSFMNNVFAHKLKESNS